jgi:hypothetical protein
VAKKFKREGSEGIKQEKRILAVRSTIMFKYLAFII